MIERIAYLLGEKDEQANIKLANELSDSENFEGIREIVDGLKDNRTGVSGDCIKVLYEIGERKPTLISEYVFDFLSLLSSKNNRLIWGAMIALSKITFLKPNEIYDNLSKVINAYKEGSVITVDNSISVFAELVKAEVDDSEEVFNLILKHLSTCRPKEVAQHSERAFICIHSRNALRFKEVLESRFDSLTDSQLKRVKELIGRIDNSDF